MSQRHRRQRALERAERARHEPAPEAETQRLAIPLALALVALCLLVYLLTLYPTAGSGDSGELAGVAATLGIAHPPGYPLFSLLGKAFTWIPFGSLAWRVNLLSAVCDTGAAAFLFAAAYRLTRNPWISLTTGGLFAFAPWIWGFATTAEVFPLNNFLVAGLIYFAIRFWETDDPRFAYLGAFWSGLAMANHQTSGPVAFPFIVFVLARGRARLLRPAALAKLAGLFALGLLPYLYLPIASSANPSLAWGNETSLEGLLTHILRREYGTLRLGNNQASDRFASTSQFLPLLWIFVRDAFKQNFAVGAILSAFGLVTGIRRRSTKGIFIAIAASLLIAVVVFCAVSNIKVTDLESATVLSRFWQMPFILLSLCAGVGLAAAVMLLPEWMRNTVSIATLLLVVAQLALNYRALDEHKTRVMETYAKSVLDELPRNAVLITTGDYVTGGLRYFRYAEGYRPDVQVLDLNLMTYGWYRRIVAGMASDLVLPKTGIYGASGYNLKDFIDVNRARHPVFLCNVTPPAWDHSLGPAYTEIPDGFASEIIPAGTPIDYEPVYARNSAVFSKWRLETDFPRWRVNPSQYVIAREYWRTRHNFATSLLVHGLAAGNDRQSFERAVDVLEDLLKEIDPPFDPLIYKNLGLAYRYVGLYTPSLAPREWQYLSRYIALGDESKDSELPGLRRYLAAHEAQQQQTLQKR